MLHKSGLTALGVAAVALGVASCSHPPAPSPAASRLAPATMLATIRAVEANDKSVVTVTPLRDPSVDGFLDDARRDENAGQYQAALKKLDAALRISPDAPDILQRRAEVEIMLDQFPAAEADARRSFELGAKVGGLCAANWQTVLEIAQADNDQAKVASAAKARAACHEAPPPSF